METLFEMHVQIVFAKRRGGAARRRAEVGKDKAWTIFMPQALKSNSHAIEGIKAQLDSIM
jgi:hypothetical protein